jgi:hypothetical protein
MVRWRYIPLKISTNNEAPPLSSLDMLDVVLFASSFVNWK